VTARNSNQECKTHQTYWFHFSLINTWQDRGPTQLSVISEDSLRHVLFQYLTNTSAVHSRKLLQVLASVSCFRVPPGLETRGTNATDVRDAAMRILSTLATNYNFS
jgi:hypothetical protein